MINNILRKISKFIFHCFNLKSVLIIFFICLCFRLKAHLLHKHDVELSLDELESMRQFNIIKTRHAYIKVQTEAVKETVKTVDQNGPSVSVKCENLEVGSITN